MSDKYSLHPATLEYIDNISKEKRKQNGQYFTPKEVCNNILMRLPDKVIDSKNQDILDPSSGTGEFLRAANNTFENPDLYGWEIDSELVEISREVVPEAKIKRTDTLRHETNKKFDLVVGNPPYYEKKLEEEIRDIYSEVIYGRTNIYSLFIFKGINLLREGGYLAFVVPPSMNNGAYFKKLREYIIENTSIEFLEIKNNSEIFEGATQSVMYIILKKGGDSRDYIFSRSDISIFSEDAGYLRRQFEDKKSLSEIGYKVRTGKLTWNEHKEKLREKPSENTVPIIWSKNIEENEVKVGPEYHSKPQYIKDFQHSKGPAIVVNRVVGKPGEGSIRAAFIEDEEKFVAENHVNVIEKSVDETSIDFKDVMKQLNLERNINLVQNITGNNQISKTELQELFPFSY